MWTLWVLAIVTSQFASGWVDAQVNSTSLQLSSADDAIFVHQRLTIYQSNPGTYRHYNGHQQLTCELCEPGHYLKKDCDGEHWRTCEQCPHNFFMPLYNNGHKCRSCGDTCADDRNLVTLQECSPTAPRRCACKRGTRQVSLGSNGPEMCIRYETGTTDDPEHDNVTSLQGSRYEETTEKTTISASNDTTSWDLDSSLANDTLSYNLAENQSIVGPIAGAAGSLLLVIIGAIAWKNSHHSTQKKDKDAIVRKINLQPVFNYVADHVGGDWWRLAWKLPGISPTRAQLDSIKEEHHPNVWEMTHKMLQDWKERNGVGASLQGLQQGLRDTGLGNLASKIGKRKWPAENEIVLSVQS
ncbi:uncharacterized protein LOC144868190 [Branchiostoma floridae x Branchiostoma japonicum]